jgi:hypothetical protein
MLGIMAGRQLRAVLRGLFVPSMGFSFRFCLQVSTITAETGLRRGPRGFAYLRVQKIVEWGGLSRPPDE